MTLILRFAIVEMVAGHLESSGETYCWAQESYEAAKDAGSATGGVEGQGLQAV
jgi:hypothetical protein